MLLAAFLMLSAEAACPAPGERISISTTPISGETLGGARDLDVPGSYRIGQFGYRDHGIEVTSADPEFDALVLTQQSGLRNRCGNPVFGPSGWNAQDDDVSRWTLTIEPQIERRAPAPGSIAAERRGAQPILRGYTAGASWPAGSYFLGLMHSEDRAAKTLIVAFPDIANSSPAVVLADLPVVFDTINIVPNHHGSESYINLSGLNDGTLTHVVLRIDERDSFAIAAKLRPSP